MFFQKKHHFKPQGKILICRTDNLGDFIQSIPSFQQLVKTYPNQVQVLCRSPQDSLLKEDPQLRDSILIVGKNVLSVVEKIRKSNFEVLINLVNDATMEQLLPHLSFIPNRIGNWNHWRSWFDYNFPIRQNRSASNRNEAEYNLDLLRVIDVDVQSPSKPMIFIQESEKNAIQRQLDYLQVPYGKKTIAVHFGMRGSAINWKFENYVKLVRILIEQGHKVILTGGNLEEWEKNESLIASVGEKKGVIFNLANRFNLRDFASFLSLIPQLIAPSTGVLHLANAVGVKVYGIYPPIPTQAPKRWEPFLNEGKMFFPQVACPAKFRCKGENCPYFPCMDKIEPEQLAQQVL